MALPRTLTELNNLDLSFITDSWNKDMIRDAMHAIIKTEENLKAREIDVWKYLYNFTPPSGQGFMFCKDDILSLIQTNMEIGHSGTSYGMTMRQIEFIAKYGLDEYKNKFTM